MFKNKQLWQIVIVIIIVVSSVILFFIPKAIDYKYSYTYQNIKDKNDNVDSLNTTLMSNEATIQSSIDRLKETESQDEILKEEVLKIRQGIKESDFELHMPSVLVSLEQEAIKNNVELTIGYNSMKTTSNDSEMSSPDEMLNEDIAITEADENTDKDDDVNKEEVNKADNESEADNESKDKDKNDDVNKDENENEDNKEDKSLPIPDISVSNLSIPGIDVTTVPIQVTGSYANVRNYIKYLDEVGMIEPSSVTMSSEGRKVSVNIVLNIFHGEVD